MDYLATKGGAALGARLRRLSETMDADAARIYGELGVAFEQRWFGVLNQLVERGSASVGDIAAALRIKHASVSEARQSLEAAGLVGSEPDPADGRRRLLLLTAEGEAFAARLAPVWSAFEAASEDLNREAGEVIAALERLELALGRQSLAERIRARVDNGQSLGGRVIAN
jgi:DNA-binding MarR family transcriptional regulator